ncbi:hypothetical protein NCU08866 [Neurospora crassa OR74A]|uniref:Uncharacterized protein n=1 Tax=Neurospora crassa (strain ATCC 24698 / 74-OR23-1A / CBS 708.71 / DSM 1257 / FGSC 987) TaxID=367110 RepID=Q7S750_NEUCR|nr:hypothetical protein NCU08866 [Neurospora crassa OR74A]EAA31366.2 hypothetical protein NCU08866 [Neurospora crassa OR74A]|eukprot:XP_960602.2 hypothetical protein NCU08866 [Neurospora crassa OR74A]
MACVLDFVLRLEMIYLQTCVVQESKTILLICDVIHKYFGKWYGQAASTCSPPGDRHVWLISSMRVPLCNIHLSLAVVVGQDAGKPESARLLPKVLGTAGTTALKALVVASNFLPKATPRRMNIFSIEVVAIVLDLGDQTFTSTAKYPELRISMSPDSA